MPDYRIWLNNELIAEVELTHDDTLTISLDGAGLAGSDGDDRNIVGVTADGQVVTWDENGEVK